MIISGNGRKSFLSRKCPVTSRKSFEMILGFAANDFVFSPFILSFVFRSNISLKINFFVCVWTSSKKSWKFERNIFARFSSFVTLLKIVIFSTSISFVNVHFDAGPSKWTFTKKTSKKLKYSLTVFMTSPPYTLYLWVKRSKEKSHWNPHKSKCNTQFSWEW